MMTIFDMMKKYAFAIVTVLLIVTMFCCEMQEMQVAELENELDKTKKALSEATFEVGELDPCPYCKKTDYVEVIHVNQDYYISCEKTEYKNKFGCGMRTGFYESRIELVKTWNAMND